MNDPKLSNATINFFYNKAREAFRVAMDTDDPEEFRKAKNMHTIAANRFDKELEGATNNVE